MIDSIETLDIVELDTRIENVVNSVDYYPEEPAGATTYIGWV